MSKADGDFRARGAAGGGGEAASPSAVESKNVKPASLTVQDDIPPVHVLVAAEQQERKETEALLSGFDRPGRGPKSAPRQRDFVDYYAKKPDGAGASSGSLRAAASGAAGVGAGGGAGGASAKARDESTVIVRRKGDGAPAWLVWGGAAVLMLLVGGLVAYVATADGSPVAATPTAPSAASAATTLTAATSPKPSVADENIPPPSAVAPSAEAPSAEAVEAAPPVVAPRGSGKREARAVPSGATTGAAATTPRATTTAETAKASPRQDFIRDL